MHAAVDSSTWHTSVPNTSGQPRRCTFAGYRTNASKGAGKGGANGQWPEDELTAGPGGLTNRQYRELAAQGKLPMTRRKLLGLPLEGLC